MTSYCIYLYSKELDSYENVGVYSKEEEALLVARALTDLVDRGMLTYIHNDFYEPFCSVEVTKYSTDNEGETIYKSEGLLEE